jgi:hypothetical protein
LSINAFITSSEPFIVTLFSCRLNLKSPVDVGTKSLFHIRGGEDGKVTYIQQNYSRQSHRLLHW